MSMPDNETLFYFDETLFVEMEEIAQMGMYETDLEKGIFKASPFFQKMFNLPPQPYYPVSLFQALIHAEDFEWVMSFFAECISQRKPFDCQYRCVLDNQVIYVRSRSKIFYNGQGKAIKALGIKQKVSVPTPAMNTWLMNEKQAANIVESISDGLLTLNKDWLVTYINPRGLEIIYPMYPSMSEIIGQNFWEAFPGQQGTILEETYRRAMGEQKPMTLEAYYPPLDRWFDIRAYPFREGLSIYFLDITQRKHTEEALHQSRQLVQTYLNELEAIYNTAPVGLCMLDKELRYIRINEHLAEINGYPVAHHLGKTVREIVPHLADEAEPLLRRIIETEEPVLNIELTGETAAQPGVKRTWVENWLPFKNKQGEVIGISIVAQELSELKRAQAASQESEERYHRLFNSMDDGFCVCKLLLDQQGKPYDYRFEEVNHTFEAHTGLKEASGKTALELVPDLEFYWIESYGNVVLNSEPIRFEQGSQVMGRWFDVYAFPFGNPQSGLFAIQFKDISERKRREIEIDRYRQELLQANKELTAANEELSQANEHLRRVNADLDSFVYTASHDLKAPIANIQGLLQILRKYLSPANLASPMVDKILALIDESINRFMKTIASMSDIIKLQQLTDQPKQSNNLAELIAEVCKDLLLLIEQADAQLEIQVGACGPVEFASNDLRSVVYNLLSNALKYRDPQRKLIIRIRCEIIEHYYLLTVTDNGLGMNLIENKRLFSMFQRMHDHVEGTGLGLYMVKKIMDKAGGKIEVESRVGMGSIFKVFFKR